jgi:hypothetical protein
VTRCRERTAPPQWPLTDAADRPVRKWPDRVNAAFSFRI